MAGLLEGRTAVLYGAGGGIGRAVARTFAREGATVQLTGRTRAPLDALADDIKAAGGTAHVAELDATDERAVDAHAAASGRIDISFNLISRGDVQGIPLVQMTTEDLLRATTTGLRSNFITARAAARGMIERGSGVILHLNSASGAGAMPGMGSTGPADAAIESFMRYLAAEAGPHGVRVCGIWTAGVAETLTDDKIAEVAQDGPSGRAVREMTASMAALRRTPRLADVAETAAFLASDRAGGITDCMTNVSAGLVLR